MTSAERDEAKMQSDTSLMADIMAALRLLSRLPLAASHSPPRPNSAWAWPIAGAFIGTLTAGVAMACLPFGASIAAAIALGAQAMITGAMHEDGLADTADGLWGGWDKKRRLEIMKDSHIGTYGVMALLVVGLIRWSALTALLISGQWTAIIAVAAISRAPMAGLMAILPNARGTGLSQSVGAVPNRSAQLALLIGVLFALLLGWTGIAAALGVAIIVTTLAMLAKAKIGGQTGDILGASQQLAEATALSVIASFI